MWMRAAAALLSGTTRGMPPAGAAAPGPPPARARPPPSRSAPRPQAPAGKERRVVVAEKRVGVGDGRLGAAAPVAGGSGIGARRMRPDPQQPHLVECGHRAAARAD